MENTQIERVWPPIAIDPGQNSLVSVMAAHDRAFAFIWHFSLILVLRFAANFTL